MKKLAKILIFILVITVSCSTFAEATTYVPNASLYLSSYGAYCYANGGGSVSVWFDVTATRDMDQVGALTIILREFDGTTWETVHVFSHSDAGYAHILASNTYEHVDSVTYQGVAGHLYYASVTVWAGLNGGGDSRVITTSTITA